MSALLALGSVSGVLLFIIGFLLIRGDGMRDELAKARSDLAGALAAIDAVEAANKTEEATDDDATERLSEEIDRLRADLRSCDVHDVVRTRLQRVLQATSNAGGDNPVT